MDRVDRPKMLFAAIHEYYNDEAEGLAQLIGMGFEEPAAARALAEAKGNAAAATNLLADTRSACASIHEYYNDELLGLIAGLAKLAVTFFKKWDQDAARAVACLRKSGYSTFDMACCLPRRGKRHRLGLRRTWVAAAQAWRRWVPAWRSYSGRTYLKHRPKRWAS